MNKIFPPFKVERFFAKYEFTAPYLMCCSDCESLGMNQLLGMADEECRQLWDKLVLSYTESQGHPLLLREISKMYRKIGVENILEVIPEEGIYLSMRSLLQSGDHVICMRPIYQSLNEVAQQIGCQIDYWDFEEDGKLEVGRLRQMIQGKTRLVIVNFPHNPTGYLPSKEQFQELIDLLRDRGVYLFCDEMYRGLEFTDVKERLDSACDLYENSVVLSGLSKTYSVPGLRVGWVCSRNNEFIDKMKIMKDYTSICGSAPSEILGIIVLRNREKIEQQNIEIVQRNYKVWKDFIGKFGQYFSLEIEPRAGSVCYPRVNKSKIKSSNHLCDVLVQDYGILIAPGDNFNSIDDAHFRVGLGRKNFNEIIQKLSEIFQDDNFLKKL